MIRSSLVCEPLKWLLIQQKLISATDERHFTPESKANSFAFGGSAKVEPPKKSRKSSQSVNPYFVWTW